jgi:myosin heavy subunit
MEKLIRKAKSDLREKDAELAKLKDGREQLVKTIEEMQEIIRKHDADSSNASKSISAMQAVSQASMERLAKLEAELTVKAEELGQQKRALDAAWTENADLKRVITDLRAQREDAKTNSDDVVRKMSDLEAQLRDIEQREAVLRATNKQLQEAVQRHTAESAMREDRLREEVADARKRWQDAISTRESMATEISQATGPLLRQISNLQESMKVKSESWQSIESSLLERAIRAESLAETAVYKTKALEEQNSVFQKHMDVANSNLRDKELLVQSLEINCDRLTRSEREQSTRVAELESRLSSESTQRLNAQSAMRELESRLKSEMRESKEALEVANKQNQLRVSMLMSEVEYLKDQLNTTKANSSLFGKSNEQNASTNSSKVSKISSGLLPSNSICLLLFFTTYRRMNLCVVP